RDGRRILQHMDRRIHVRAAVHDAFDELHQHTVARVKLHNIDGEPARGGGAARPLRNAVAVGLGEIEELQTVGIESRHSDWHLTSLPFLTPPAATETTCARRHDRPRSGTCLWGRSWRRA